MGKYGSSYIPNFDLDGDDDDTNDIEKNDGVDENLAEILGLGDHGNDFAKITIKTEDGEEVELEFKYDGEGMIHAEHKGRSYSIPVEVEVAEKKLVKGQVKLDKNKNGKIDKEDFQLLRKTKKPSSEKTGTKSFKTFVNECWSPMTEGYNPAMSEEAKRAVKTICEEMLINEAKSCHEDADPNHTYESYLNECGQYMTECMMEAASNMDV